MKKTTREVLALLRDARVLHDPDHSPTTVWERALDQVQSGVTSEVAARLLLGKLRYLLVGRWQKHTTRHEEQVLRQIALILARAGELTTRSLRYTVRCDWCGQKHIFPSSEIAFIDSAHGKKYLCERCERHTLERDRWSEIHDILLAQLSC